MNFSIDYENVIRGCMLPALHNYPTLIAIAKDLSCVVFPVFMLEASTLIIKICALCFPFGCFDHRKAITEID